jgi:hypothetical protein
LPRRPGGVSTFAAMPDHLRPCGGGTLHARAEEMVSVDVHTNHRRKIPASAWPCAIIHTQGSPIP